MGNNFLTRYWIARPLRTFHVVLAVTAVAAYFIGSISGEAWLVACGDVIAVTGILHFFIHANLHRKYQFSTDYHKTYSLPDKKIRRINAVFLVILALAVFVGMVVARELYTGTLIDKLQLLFMYLLQQGFGFIFGSDGLGKEEVIVQENQSLLDAMNGVAAQNERAWETAANSIQTIVIIVGLAVFVILGILAITGLIRRMILSSRQTGEGKTLYETHDREESLLRNVLRREKKPGSSPAGRIRRIYQRCINRNRRRRQSVPTWMTPSEIESMVSLPEEEHYRLLHTMYEKARYSEDGCSDQEANQLKTLKI